MGHHDKTTQTVTVEELGVSTAFEGAARIAILERNGVLMHAEVLDEIARQRTGRARGR